MRHERAVLTPAELAEAKRKLAASGPGYYTLKQIYGRKGWFNVLSPTDFGERFSASFDAGEFAGYERGPKKSAAWTYGRAIHPDAGDIP